jgi:hypothetical protein
MWEYRAVHQATLDGDTVRLLADLGFGVRMQIEVRLTDVHAPELSEEGGMDTLQYVMNWMAAVHITPLKWPLIVRTQQTVRPVEAESIRSFTRYVGDIFQASNRSAPSLNADVRVYLAGLHWSKGK